MMRFVRFCKASDANRFGNVPFKFRERVDFKSNCKKSEPVIVAYLRWELCRSCEISWRTNVARRFPSADLWLQMPVKSLFKRESFDF